MSINSIATRPNPVLTRIVRGFNPDGYVSELLLPTIMVKAYVGEINVDGAEHFRIHDTDVTYDAQTPLLKISTSRSAGWSIQEHSIKGLITESDVAKEWPDNPAGGRAELQRKMSIKTKTVLLGSRENFVMNRITTTANYTLSNTVTLAGTQQYSDYTNSTPATDFNTAMSAIYDNSYMVPNIAVMNWKTFNVLRRHPQLVSRLSVATDRSAGLSLEQLAVAMDVERVVISRAKKNTAAEGQTAVMANMMDKSIVFMAVDANPVADIPSLSFGYSFKYEDMVADTWTVKEPKNGEYVRVSEKRDDVVFSNGFAAGYLIKNAIA